MRNCMRNKEKKDLFLALTRLLQVVTLILLIYCFQAGIAVTFTILRLFLTISQPASIL